MSRKAAIEAFNKNPTLEKLNLITGGSDIGVNVGDPSLAKGKKLIERGGKTFVTDSDMPTGLPGFAASVQDFFDPSKDRDKKGKLNLNPFAQISEKNIGLPELSESDLTYSPVQKKRLSNALEDIFEKPKTALEEAEEGLDFYEQNYGRIAGLNRKLRRDAAVDAQLQYMATEPVRQAFLNRAAEQAAQRGLRVRGALEAMPSNIQNIMTAKQAQRSLASSAFAEEARAAAAQQDAATRFAGLGMQRRFG
jgi:phosphatidylserine/phosphatidylglycerophosphate/cardiolipin synthase-like enzyme